MGCVMEKCNGICRSSVIVFLTFFILSNSAAFPQQAKITKRMMTYSEFKKFKKFTGTYEKGKNYNQIINGHGTGLMPPTEEQWNTIKNKPMLVDKIEFPLNKAAAPSRYDNASTIWFPPIGNQGSQGACVAFATVYYTKTFQEAKEHNWDLSGCKWVSGHPTTAYQDKIFSPAFTYNLENYGQDLGSGYGDNINIIKIYGCCTWEKMPYSSSDYTTWPSESAWRQAPVYRSQTGYGVNEDYLVDTETRLEDLKLLLSNGNIAIIPVYANYYSHFTSEDLWTIDNYNPQFTDHANTVVGYDDNYGPYTESGNETYGAFKVTNSWGVGSWEHVADGFYYISYECMKQRIKYAYFYQNLENYVPQMLAVIEISNCNRHDNVITFGLGDPSSPTFLKYTLPGFSLTGGNIPFPNNPMIIDITEFIPYMSESTNRFFMQVHKQYGSSTADLQYFAIEMYDDYLSGIPKNIYVSTETPMNGPSQDRVVDVNVYTGPLPVELTSFKASIINTDVLLSWETATEINNYGFEIERKIISSSLRNTDWIKIGFINGHGNSNSPKTYRFADKNLTGGSKFEYRLKQIDNDGRFEFSDSVEVTFIPDKFELLQNYPNPFNPSTRIKYVLPFESSVEITVYNMTGQRIKEFKEGVMESGYHMSTGSPEIYPQEFISIRLLRSVRIEGIIILGH